MRITTFSLLACGLLLGAAHAESAPSTGFDRVGLASDRPAATQTAQTAPGEARRTDGAALPERRREMARRLVWLMLSAR